MDMDSPECNMPERCAQLKKETLLKSLKPPVSQMWADDLDDLDDEPWCKMCRDFFKQEFGHHRKEMWNALPSYFDLPDWSELCREQ
jgi:hypothetical protein